MDSANVTSFSTLVVQARDVAGHIPSQLESVLQAVLGASIWNILFTLLAMAVVYDQCRTPFWIVSNAYR